MSKLVFVVDDSPTVTLSLTTSLNLNGYKVESASDGLAAIQRLKMGLKPQLIITDFNMPNMNGIEFIRAVKEIPSLRFIPILMLTTESDSQKRDEGKKLGITGWLIKPISGTDFIKVIKQVLPLGT